MIPRSSNKRTVMDKSTFILLGHDEPKEGSKNATKGDRRTER